MAVANGAGWGERRGPEPVVQAADRMADAIRTFLSWRSIRNEDVLRAAVAAYDEIRPRGRTTR
jgi:hypothetical protein